MSQLSQNTLPIATAADYAEALLAARRAKAWLTLSLLFVMLTQLTMFSLLRYYKPLPMDGSPAEHRTREIIQYFIGLLDIAGLILPALLAVVVYLILNVQLVGRLLGVGHLIPAFLWSILLCLLLFPWQAVLNNPAISSDPTNNALGMKIPGVLYTWAEISNPTAGANFGQLDLPYWNAMGLITTELKFVKSRVERQPVVLILHWARFVAFPILAVLILTIIHFKSDRGLRLSLSGDTTAL